MRVPTESMVPASVDDWTYETVFDLLTTHAFEPDWFDLKEMLHPSSKAGDRDERTRDLTQVVSAFANSEGGYLIFGVKNPKAGLDPRSLIVGIPASPELQHEFAQKIGRIQPRVAFSAPRQPIPLPGDSSRVIFVVYIPKSPLRPHMDLAKHSFYRRGEGGSAVLMDWYEVREQMINTEDRWRSVVLLSIELMTLRLVADGIQAEGQHAGTMEAVERFDTALLSAVLPDAITVLGLDESLIKDLTIVRMHMQRVNTALNRYQATQKGKEFGWKRVSDSLTPIYNLLQECKTRVDSQLIESGRVPPK